MFKDLYVEGTNSDVTLVSDDQIQFKAHKIVLRACSPVFKKIIDNNPTQHPLIYLRGIQSYEMESILQYMYLGEGKFYFDRMVEFIKAAKDLEVKDISKSVELPNKAKDMIEENVTEVEEKETEEGDEPELKRENTTRNKQPQNQISSDAKFTQCPECGKEFTKRGHMLRHYRAIHEAVKYHCDQCDSQFTQQANLQRHIQSNHEGIKYPCNQCDYQATQQGSLQTHIQSKHESVKYPCYQCDSQFTQRGSLQKHIQSVHKEASL